MKKRIITISGDLSSGKSTTADGIAGILGYTRFSSGDLMRKISLNKGLTLEEYSKIAETNHEIDKEIDAEVRKQGDNSDIVIDSRLAFHWIPGSFKIFLSLPPEIGKMRMLKSLAENALRKKSENPATPEEAFLKIKTRRESEEKRYREIYQINIRNMENFDLVLSTEDNNLEKVIKIIVSEYENWIKN